MNFYSKSFAFTALGVASMLLASCNEDVLEGGNTGEAYDGPVVYISAGISLPSTGSRSATDDPDGSDGNKTNSDASPDYEIGYEYENDIRSMILLIATPEEKGNKYIAHTIVSGITKAPTSMSDEFQFTVTGAIKHADLQAAYEKEDLLKTTQEVNIYAFCNYTDDLLTKIQGLKQGDPDWADFDGEVVETASGLGHAPIANTIWAKRSFLMSNAEVVEFTFPEELNGEEKGWDLYADSGNPLPLTDKPIKVERAAARIDFRDGSKDLDSNNPGNTYHLTVQDEEGAQTTHNLFDIQLTRMSLVNMSKKYYVLRRVAPANADGEAETGRIFLGKEKTGFFVVDTDWNEKLVTGPNDALKAMDLDKAEKNFNFPVFTKPAADAADRDKHLDLVDNNVSYTYNRAGWYTDNIKEIIENGENDTWSDTPGQYKIWRYVTENTLPSVKSQKNVQSTGVVFKGSIKPGSAIDLKYTNKGSKENHTERYVTVEVEKALRVAAAHIEPGTNLADKGIKLADETPVTDAEWQYPTLYMFQNILYASVDDVVRYAVLEGTNSPLYESTERVLKEWKYDETAKTYKLNGNGSDVLTVAKYNDILTGEDEESKVDFREEGTESVAAEAFRLAAPKEGFTVYRASNEEDGEGWGYYCYYFYWNRHNDNGRNGQMGVMEFATVRNNVYKLAVTAVGQLGHPRFPGYDPEPPTPNTDDEVETRYIQVKVDVLPWVVRVNNITF